MQSAGDTNAFQIKNVFLSYILDHTGCGCICYYLPYFLFCFLNNKLIHFSDRLCVKLKNNRMRKAHHMQLSYFCFCHNVCKGHLLQMHKKASICWKEFNIVTVCGNYTSVTGRSIRTWTLCYTIKENVSVLKRTGLNPYPHTTILQQTTSFFKR